MQELKGIKTIVLDGKKYALFSGQIFIVTDKNELGNVYTRLSIPQFNEIYNKQIQERNNQPTTTTTNNQVLQPTSTPTSTSTGVIPKRIYYNGKIYELFGGKVYLTSLAPLGFQETTNTPSVYQPSIPNVGIGLSANDLLPGQLAYQKDLNVTEFNRIYSEYHIEAGQYRGYDEQTKKDIIIIIDSTGTHYKAYNDGESPPENFGPLSTKDSSEIKNLIKTKVLVKEISGSEQPPTTSPTLTGSTEAEQQTTNQFIDSSTGKLVFNPDELEQFSLELDKRIAELRKVPFESLTPEQQEEWKQLQLFRQQLREAAKTTGCFVREQSASSWTVKDTPDCQQFNKSIQNQYVKKIFDTELDLPEPCGTSTLSKINIALHKFFISLKEIKKYGELVLISSINKITDITNLIRSTSSIIAAVLKILVQRMRNFILNRLRKLISNVIDNILPNLAKVLKDVLIQEIVQAIICKFDDIIKGLSNLVSDFLFALVGKVVNIGFCAVEQFTNSLVNNLAATIDNQIAPLLDSISDVLGGGLKLAGSVFEAIDYILGFESFLCASPNCPELLSFKASPWSGPAKTKIDSFVNFKIPNENEVLNLDSVDSWVSGFSIFGSTVGDNQEELPSSVTQCDTAAFRCGPPSVELFGGGGTGAFGSAVVNSIGQVVGVNLTYGGTGYTTPPYVTFQDSCGNGNYASGYTEINDDGEVVRVVMVNNGSGYLDQPNGLNEFGLPVTTITTPGTPQTTPETPGTTPGIPETPGTTTVKTFVACIDKFKIINTGIGYSVDDLVEITPNSPGLEVKISMTEEGQIIAMDIISPSCGLTEVPQVTINSATGAGVQIQPILKFYTLDEYKELQDNNYNPQELVEVINCVYPR